MLWVLSEEESKENLCHKFPRPTINFHDQQCALVVVCAPDMKLLNRRIPNIMIEDMKTAKTAWELPTEGILIGNLSSYNRFDVPFLNCCVSHSFQSNGSFLVLLKGDQSAMNCINKSAAEAGWQGRMIFVEVIPDANPAFFWESPLAGLLSRLAGIHHTVKLMWNRCILLTLPGISFASCVSANILTTFGAEHCIFESQSLENYAV